MEFVAERKDSLFRSRLLFVTACPAKCGIKSVLVESLFERVGLHDFGMSVAVLARIDAKFQSLLVDVD